METGDTTPEYQPPDLPDMDIKPDMMKCVKTDPASVAGAGAGAQHVAGAGGAGHYGRGHGDPAGPQDPGYLGGAPLPAPASTPQTQAWTHSQHSHQYSTALQQQQVLRLDFNL